MIDQAEIYYQLYKIRRFEETVLDNFSKGVFFGTTHTYLGQEANAVGILSNIREEDLVVSNHRCHGHFLAYGGDARALFAELMGRSTGVCGGRGGSQHLQWRNFYSNGILGGIVPIATGMGLAEKFKKSSAITIVFLGDGTLGEGVVYESLNLASLWNIPILFILENNRIAQTTPIELAVSGKIADRFRAFNIPVSELDTSDVMEVQQLAGKLIVATRNQKSPHALILHTYRFGPHSKGDDTRQPSTLEFLRKKHDPLKIHASRIEREKRMKIEAIVNVEVLNAYQNAVNDPFPRL
jgi:TPP-dependent pyruvate/acetoin dehydrogenase alpha subunit